MFVFSNEQRINLYIKEFTPIVYAFVLFLLNVIIESWW